MRRGNSAAVPFVILINMCRFMHMHHRPSPRPRTSLASKNNPQTAVKIDQKQYI